MTSIALLSAGLVLLYFVFLIGMFWATKMVRAAVATTLGLLLTGFSFWAMSVEALSHEKPGRLEFARPAIADVLWVGGEEGVRLELLLEWPGSRGPRLYSFPWDADDVQDMRQAQAKAKAKNRQLKIRDPFSKREKGQPAQGSGDGSGEGNGTGTGAEGGLETGDNANVDSRFYAPPPPALPEKLSGF